MMALPRLLALVLAAALVSACGASSVNEFAAGKPQLGMTPAQPANSGTGTPAPQDSASRSEQQAALRKVALSVTSFSDPGSKSYKIGPLDVLEVTVFKVPDLSKSVQVSETGTINYPLIGEVQAGGWTAREVEQALTKALGDKYLQNPQVTVFVREYHSQRVTVEGAVKKPGVLPMAGGMSLLQAVAQAGGLEDVADTTVAVFRTANGKRAAGRYDISDIRSGKAEDPQLEAGDVIIVSTSDVKQGFNYALRLLPLATIVPYL